MLDHPGSRAREAFILDAWCSYCIAAALLMTALSAVWAAILAITMRGG